MNILKVCAGVSLALLLVGMGCGSSSTPATVAGGAGGGGASGAGGGGASGSGDASAGKDGAAGSATTGGGGAKGTCGIPACLTTIFDAGCWPSNSAGPCTKSMQVTATTDTFTYCFANHTKLVVAAAVATGDQLQTYSNDSGTCFTATVVPNAPETYFNPSGTAVGTEMTAISDGGAPILTFMCTGGAPVVVTDLAACNPIFSFAACTTDPSCQ